MDFKKKLIELKSNEFNIQNDYGQELERGFLEANSFEDTDWKNLVKFVTGLCKQREAGLGAIESELDVLQKKIEWKKKFKRASSV